MLVAWLAAITAQARSKGSARILVVGSDDFLKYGQSLGADAQRGGGLLFTKHQHPAVALDVVRLNLAASPCLVLVESLHALAENAAPATPNVRDTRAARTRHLARFLLALSRALQAAPKARPEQPRQRRRKAVVAGPEPGAAAGALAASVVLVCNARHEAGLYDLQLQQFATTRLRLAAGQDAAEAEAEGGGGAGAKPGGGEPRCLSATLLKAPFYHTRMPQLMTEMYLPNGPMRAHGRYLMPTEDLVEAARLLGVLSDVPDTDVGSRLSWVPLAGDALGQSGRVEGATTRDLAQAIEQAGLSLELRRELEAVLRPMRRAPSWEPAPPVHGRAL
ncbi:hypothetical protein HYH03_002703 [Edaphochlamys debaryana]|uniref:Uncharacterized protein n=1 Tax=Edaphochlamys debaryana TaxID=47281 RepID=A0A836C3S5_9CHLO|nr:hypothetical protein HYH03_002703 [Edaphochlamys debaryana]|eukprot:KAG2499120.1 hypothetical protein HYH03_002703 [Edaphochlamys debaryana]